MSIEEDLSRLDDVCYQRSLDQEHNVHALERRVEKLEKLVTALVSALHAVNEER